ncbi:TIGR03757 family integrating conjugative element protein [Cupriavidus necator]|uniref:TIGR03757 family integrating conjugative element protein n=1 Tax=Cupriavidus necator TaxID=106590 RepID=UPI0005B41F33|nr:TIGR03757 family integrating conjugative element protein [Cupriavidus necator]
MPVFLFKSMPGWPALSIAAVLPAMLLTFSTATFAADVLVVTDSRHPVRAMGGERVIELDLPSRIEAELSAGLPADASLAADLVRQRMREGKDELQRRIGRAYQGVADAWGLGIVKVPAVVVDRRYVVYGDPDVARAVACIEAHRRTQP